MKSFAETIRETRTAKNLLLREVAAKLNIDASLLSRIENGRKRPTRDQVIVLAGILGVDKQELLVHYLSDRVIYELDGDDLAMRAIQAAEKKVRYKSAPRKKKQHK